MVIFVLLIIHMAYIYYLFVLLVDIHWILRREMSVTWHFVSWIFVKYLTYILTCDLYTWLMTCQEVTAPLIPVYWLMRTFASDLWWECTKVLPDQRALSKYIRLRDFILYWGSYCVVHNDELYVLQLVSKELKWKTLIWLKHI